MPVTDPVKRAIAMKAKLYVKICRNCGSRNPMDAEKCRRCHSTNLRPKNRQLGPKR